MARFALRANSSLILGGGGGGGFNFSFYSVQDCSLLRAQPFFVSSRNAPGGGGGGEGACVTTQRMAT